MKKQKYMQPMCKESIIITEKFFALSVPLGNGGTGQGGTGGGGDAKSFFFDSEDEQFAGEKNIPSSSHNIWTEE